MAALVRRRIPWLALWTLPLLFALVSVPAGAGEPMITVTGPADGAVVTGEILFQGTATDPDGDLNWVFVTVDGAKGAQPKVKISGNQANADWQVAWNSQNAPDGRRAVTVFAEDKAGNASPAVNLTVIVDNFKEPTVVGHQLRFDAQGDGQYGPWNKLEETPTTRLSFEVTFSEEMDESSLLSTVDFEGGSSGWDLAPMGGASYWVNVSYLEANTSYNFTVGTEAMDLAGNPLTEVYTVSLQTVTEPTPGTPEGPDGGILDGGLALSLDSPLLWVGVGGAGAAVAVAVAYRTGLLFRLKQRLEFRRLTERLSRSSREEERP